MAYGSATLVTDFTMHNYSASASPAIFTVGAVFKRGDVPTAKTIRVQRHDTSDVVSCTLDAVKSWDDGSLMKAALNIIDETGDVAGSGSRVYDIMAVSGSRAPGSSGPSPWAWVIAEDLNLEITGMQNSAGTDLSPTQRDIDTAAHAAVTTRRKIYTDGSRCQVLWWWGMAAADGHLKGEHYATIYRANDGTVLGARYVCVASQDWFTQDPLSEGRNKDKVRYFATLKRGGATLAAYYGDAANTVRIQHPYHSAWATVQKTGDNKGRPFWIAGSESREPTLWCEFDVPYLMTTGLFVTLDQTTPLVARTLVDWDYTPFHAFSHQPSLPSTGGSLNRGDVLGIDAIRMQKQTRATDRAWEMASLFAIHCCRARVRNHASDTTIGDITNRLIPFVLGASTTASSYSATGQLDGLGTRQRYGYTASDGTIAWGTYASDWSTVVEPNWSPADSAHMPAIGYASHLLTGHRMFADAAMDAAMHMSWMWGGTAKPWDTSYREITYGNRQTTAGWTNWYYTPGQPPDQVRGHAWSLNNVANGWVVASDGSPEAQHLAEYLDNRFAQELKRINFVKAQSSPNQANRRLGLYYQCPNTQEWEISFVSLSNGFAARRYRSADALAVAGYYMSRHVKIMASSYPLIGSCIFAEMMPGTSESYDPVTNDYASYNSGTIRVKQTNADPELIEAFGPEANWRNYVMPSVGDTIYFSVRNGAGAMPAEFTPRTPYYIVAKPTTRSLKVSDTPGGSPLTLSGSTDFLGWLPEPAALLNEYDIFDAALEMVPNSMDSYPMIYMAAVAEALAWKDVIPLEATGGEISAATTNGRAVWDAMLPTATYEFANNANVMAIWWRARP